MASNRVKVESMYVFFESVKFRHFLRELWQKKQKITEGKGKMNPLILYIMFKVNKIMLTLLV